MPIRQGSIDQLCGIYSVMNATEVVIGKFHYDRRLKRKASQRKTLFSNLIGHLAKHDMLENVLTSGIADIDIEGGLIDIAIKSVKKYQKRKLCKRKAFETDDVTLDEYWEKLTQHISQGRYCRDYFIKWPDQTLDLRQSNYTRGHDSIGFHWHEKDC